MTSLAMTLRPNKYYKNQYALQHHQFLKLIVYMVISRLLSSLKQDIISIFQAKFPKVTDNLKIKII